MSEFTRHEIQLLADYHEMTTDVMHMIFPQLTRMELGMAIDDAIKQYLENPNVLINNSYKHVEVQTTLLELAQYIYDKQPIMTNQGVLFSRHGLVPNPIAKMLQGFLADRKKMKKQMFQYPKGTQEFAKYNLLQLLLEREISQALYRGTYGCALL